MFKFNLLAYITGCEKFGIEAADSEVQFCLREDGTEVDAECFAAVQSNTVLLILKEGEMWSPGEKMILFIECQCIYVGILCHNL